jgi:hypothetical protein
MSFITTPNELPAPGTTGNVLTSNGTIWQSAVASSLPAVGASGNVLTSNGTVWASAAPTVVNLGTSVVASSATDVTFTGIPSTAKIVYLTFYNVSSFYLSTGQRVQITLGTSSGLETSGYQWQCGLITNPVTSGPYTDTTQGKPYFATSQSGTKIEIITSQYITNLNGTIMINLEDQTTNKYTGGGVLTDGSREWASNVAFGISLSDKLSQIKINCLNNISGSLGISYLL